MDSSITSRLDLRSLMPAALMHSLERLGGRSRRRIAQRHAAENTVHEGGYGVCFAPWHGKGRWFDPTTVRCPRYGFSPSASVAGVRAPPSGELTTGTPRGICRANVLGRSTPCAAAP